MSTAVEGVKFPNTKVIRATAKALLVLIEDEEVWIPVSQITDDSEVWQEGQEGLLVITEWIAEQKGL